MDKILLPITTMLEVKKYFLMSLSVLGMFSNPHSVGNVTTLMKRSKYGLLFGGVMSLAVDIFGHCCLEEKYL